MSHTTRIRRAASVFGATGLVALSLAGPASARQDPGAGDLPRCTTGCFEGGTTPGTTQLTAIDDNAVEYLQLGAGVLAGIALTGAGAAVASRRSHHPRFHTA
jgi:hypothetical protein